jgi:hypothetical protein
MIWATFYCTGKYPVLIMALHIVGRWTMLFLGIYFNIFQLVRSYPGAVLG